ncbi:hypothetical protein [Bosea sp. RAC05]|uniref:hypothetical protein n=1 Tax=Bosea sp. RAC05 TaxID=1842539 RepID=UPI000858D145|nr:hypothetical protein [Bosea sp. RAC05]AOG03090.1 hypothetical protein BSY19_5220 [Bosea sp. RAC05]
MIVPVTSHDILAQAMAFATDSFGNQDHLPYRAVLFVDMPRGELAIVPLMNEVDRATMLNSAREYISSHRGTRFALAVASPRHGDVEQIHLTFVDGANQVDHYEASMVVEGGRRKLGPYNQIDSMPAEVAEVLGDTVTEHSAMSPR